jgi:hypothetical protein
MCTPVRYTPIRYTPMRHTPTRCTLVGCTPVRYNISVLIRGIIFLISYLINGGAMVDFSKSELQITSFVYALQLFLFRLTEYHTSTA